MKRKFTLLIFFAALSVFVWADFVPTGRLLYKEDFGGNDSADVRVSDNPLPYMSNNYTQAVTDGWQDVNSMNYIVTKSGYCNGDTAITNPDENARFSQWHIQDDHTYPNDYERGYLLEIDASGEEHDVFFSVGLGSMCSGAKLEFSAWAANVITAFITKQNDNVFVYPNLRFAIYDADADTLIAAYETGDLPLDITGNADSTLNNWQQSALWHQYGFQFQMPVGVDTVNLQIENNATGAIGNDFALDDIEIRIVIPQTKVLGSNAACEGDSAQLVADFDNKENLFAEPLEYKWFFSENENFDEVLDWAVVGNSDTLVITEMASDNEGWYIVQVAGNGALEQTVCSSFSEPFRLSLSLPSNLIDSVSLDSGALYNDVPYYHDTILIDSTTNMYGCDSVHTIVISINVDSVSVDTTYSDTIVDPVNPLTFSISFSASCADNPINFSLTLDSVSIDSVLFALDTLSYRYLPKPDSIQSDTIPFYPATGTYSLAYRTYHGDEITHSGSENIIIPDTIKVKEDRHVEWGAVVNGVQCKSDTVFVDTLTTAQGCDSIYILNVTVGPRPEVTSTSCSITFDSNLGCGDSILSFTLVLDSGFIDSVRFVMDDAKGLFYPSTDSVQEAVVPIKLKAGERVVIAQAFQLDSMIYQTSDTIRMRYPSSVLYQKWNDFVGVLTKRFNDGYTFTSFQWYKNGEIIEGATESYIYQPLEEGAEYAVLLSDTLGHSAMTCPLVAVHKDDTVAYPTVVTSRRKIRVSLPKAAKVVVYDIQGNQCASELCAEGNSWLGREFVNGVYLVAIYPEDKSIMQIYKILVR